MVPIKVSAEQRYRDAFERLKNGNPVVLDKGTPVSQNNVAKEAGVDPTALKRNRFGSLIEEIKEYVDHRDALARSEKETRNEARRARESEAQRADRLERERDIAVSKLNSLVDKLFNVMEERDRLQRKLADLEPPPIQFPPTRK